MSLAISTINPIICTNLMQGYNSTVTSGGVTTLTTLSSQAQFFTGTASHTVTLPAATSLVNGYNFVITNRSTGTVLVRNSALTTVINVLPNSQMAVIVIDSTGVAGIGGWYSLQTSTNSGANGGYSSSGNYSATTIGAVTADLCTIASTSGAAGTSYTIVANLTLGSAPTDGGMVNIFCRAKNILGTVTVQPPMMSAVSLDSGINTADVTVISVGANIIVRVVGVGGKTIRWFGKVELITQEF